MFCYSMQAILMNENERRYSTRANLMDFIICARRVSRYIEGKHTRGLRRRFTRI